MKSIINGFVNGGDSFFLNLSITRTIGFFQREAIVIYSTATAIKLLAFVIIDDYLSTGD